MNDIKQDAPYPASSLLRALKQARDRGGMQVGMPKVTVDCAHLESALKRWIAVEANARALQAERDELRAKLRWRKWPDESPDTEGWYFILLYDEPNDDPDIDFWKFDEDGWHFHDPHYWRPVDLPDQEANT